MKSIGLKLALGMFLASALPSSALFAAEEAAKALPTLLIKGEVVSVDSNDPSAVLLKVKDRYGFETPIFLTKETKINQGDATLNVANLATGTAVEVEYNFDVNTAKRHAVSVKVAAPTPTAAVPAAPTPSPAPAASPAPVVPSAPAATQVATPVAPPAQSAVPQASMAPTTSAPPQQEKAAPASQ